MVHMMRNGIYTDRISTERGIAIWQEDLAREVDVSRRTIITAESDNCNLSLATALRLAAYFQRTVDELFVKEEG